MNHSDLEDHDAEGMKEEFEANLLLNVLSWTVPFKPTNYFDYMYTRLVLCNKSMTNIKFLIRINFENTLVEDVVRLQSTI